MAGRKVLVLGAGGREHALAMTLARCGSVDAVVVAPGNAGCVQSRRGAVAPISRLALAIQDPDAVVAAAREAAIDLVVVGPEAPLCAGVVDALTAAGVTAFGPTAEAARLEGSKAFMKRFCRDHDIPTAPFLITSDYAEAARHIETRARARVVKTDGLAGGKGALVTADAAAAKAAARALLVEGRFGAAGRTVVIEDRLDGHELSVHVVTDGTRYMTLPIARDYKRVGDGDTGPNTGGMGAIGPITIDPTLRARIDAEVIEPTLAGMRATGTPYRGVLYAGLMVAPRRGPVPARAQRPLRRPRDPTPRPPAGGRSRHALGLGRPGRPG
ncbi:MAG: phosphoribosylamine--glycine ligase [Myxococcota bacterium]